MRIIISEQQLQRIIKEFYKKKPKVRSIGKGWENYGKTIKELIIYELQVYLSKKRTSNYSMNSEMFLQEYVEYINETIIRLFNEGYIEFDDENIENIIKENLASVEGKKIIMKSPKKLVIFRYDEKGTYAGFEKLKEAIDFTSKKLDTYINENFPSDLYNMAPTYSGQEIEDELTQKIYDWEHTKTILERLYNDYMVSDLVDEQLFEKLKGKNYIDEIFKIMDKEMEKNNYEIFHKIKETDLKYYFNMFLESYIKFYSKRFNEEQLRSDTINLKKNLPLEILMSKIFNMIYKNL
jgi:hypothetical protein